MFGQTPLKFLMSKKRSQQKNFSSISSIFFESQYFGFGKAKIRIDFFPNPNF